MGANADFWLHCLRCEFKAMENQELAQFLDAAGITEYMVIVGGLIWVSGLRFDILFSTMYLAWSTKQPRRHHLKMARHVLKYLYTTKGYLEAYQS